MLKGILKKNIKFKNGVARKQGHVVGIIEPHLNGDMCLIRDGKRDYLIGTEKIIITREEYNKHDL